MTSTWTMSVFTMWMQYTLLQEVFERFHVFNRLWVQLQKQSCKVEDILGHVLERDYVFMPTLHSSHCVLWTKMHHSPVSVDNMKVTNQVIFYDPLNNEATSTLKSLAYMAIRTICSRLTDHCIVTNIRNHILHILMQPNGWDYGYY